MLNITGWFEINDFRPGIAGDYFSFAGATNQSSILKDGYATVANTYQCHSVDGPLVPLPRKQQGQTKTHIRQGSPAYTTAYYPANQLCSYLMDACVIAPVFRANQTTNGGVPADPYEVAALYAYGQSDNTSNNYYLCLEGVRVRPYDSVTIGSFYFSRTTNTIDSILPYPIPGGTILMVRRVTGGTYYFFLTLGANSAYTGFSMISGGGAIAAPFTTYTLFDTEVSANYVYASMVQLFPNPSSPTTNSITTMAPASTDMSSSPNMIVHQGRLCGFTFIGNPRGLEDPFGGGDMVSFSTGLVEFSAAYDPLGDITSTSPGFLYSNDAFDGGIGTGVSLNTNELFLVFHQGGGMIVRGDIDDPSVSKLPFVQSTGGIINRAVSTPIGVVYLTDHGVYAWQGGQNSTNISPQLNGRFWDYRVDPTNEIMLHRSNWGRLDYFDPFVCVPGNYVMNKDTGGWWRLLDPTANGGRQYSTYQYSGWLNRLFAFPYRIDSTNSTLYDYYDNQTLALSYSWQSQPLVQTTLRKYNVNTIELTAQRPSGTSTCTVDVTVTGVTESGATITSPTTSFDLQPTTADRPSILTKSIVSHVNARYIQVKVVATSNAVAAPKIYNLRIGYHEAQGVTRA